MSEATRTTGTFLDRIVAARRTRLATARRETPLPALAELASSLPGEPVDFAARLRAGRGVTPAGARLRLIGEIKRASPSRGTLNAELDAGEQAQRYAGAGAAAISVLTEPDFFEGSVDDLSAARDAFGGDADRPALLRKDFIFDEYQVVEARAYGADALLLIVMMLEPSALRDLLALTHDQGLQALVEVHSEAEVSAAIDAGARVIGVNNRDLRTFEEDLATFERLAPLVPDDVVRVAESAIRSAADATRMLAAGADALLVGEALVTSGDAAAKARELMLVASDTVATAARGREATP